MSDAILEADLRPTRVLAARGRREWSGNTAAPALIARAKAAAWLLIFPAVSLTGWIIGSERGWLAEQILPRPADVLHTFNEMLASGELAQHAGISLLRVLMGFAVGAGAGLVLGAAMSLSRRVDDHVRPLFTAIAQVPALAWIPLAMLLLGIGETLKIAVIAKAAFVPVAMNTSAGIANVPRALV